MSKKKAVKIPQTQTDLLKCHIAWSTVKNPKIWNSHIKTKMTETNNKWSE